MLDRNRLTVRARELRRTMSPPERILWAALRERPGGLKFRRQHPLARYVVDFYSASARLVIEVDGESHRMGNRPQQDEARDAWLIEQGLRVVRVNARDVFRDLEAVLKHIINAAGE